MDIWLTVGHMDEKGVAKAVVKAYFVARDEAEAWAAVRDGMALAATGKCRDELGMSIRETAKRLGVTRSTLARTWWKGQSDRGPLSVHVEELERAHRDEVWINVGLGRSASPQAQYNAGLITEFERDALLDESQRERTPVPDQIRDAVARFPGITSLELPRMLGLSVLLDLKPFAEEAECLVDGGSRWWPARTVAQLQPGDEIPRHIGQFETEPNYKWATIESVTPQDVFGEFIDVKIRFGAGDTDTSTWSGTPSHELHPVRSPRPVPAASGRQAADQQGSIREVVSANEGITSAELAAQTIGADAVDELHRFARVAGVVVDTEGRWWLHPTTRNWPSASNS